MLDRVLRVALVAAAVLWTAGAHSASADDGPPSDAAGRHPRTVLRPTPTQELVLLVGGFGSRPDDGAFDRIAAALRSDPRFHVVRFGADGAFPYHADGAIDGSAQTLVAQVRAQGPGFAGVHLVTHSMGGAVVDRAFAFGLAPVDGVRSFVALAAPHDGSTPAREGVRVLRAAGDDAPFVRDMLAGVADVAAPAVRDLALLRSTPSPEGVTRVDLRFATDQLVLTADARSPDVRERTLLPRGFDGLNGHGAILRDERVLDTVRRTVSTGLAPIDGRTPLERFAADLLAAASDGLTRIVLGLASFTLLALLRIRRLRVLIPRFAPLGSQGQAIVEFALVLPLLLAMAFGVVFLGELGVARLSLEHAAAEAARTGALTNSDALMRETAAAAAAPLDASRLRVEIDPAEGAGDRAGDPRGALVRVRLVYPLAAPPPLGSVMVGGYAVRRIEWTP